MGFGTGFAWFMLGIVVIMFFAGMVVVYGDRIIKTTSGLVSKGDSIEGRMNTAMDITKVFNNCGLITIFAENMGSEQLDLTKVDLFVNNIFIARDTTVRTFELNSSLDIRNQGLWGPGEVLMINVTSVAPKVDTVVKLINQYGSSVNATLLDATLICS
ncbi:hypothetical protein COV93_01045 [Candidatus Woesearchaeota archaeon CG11_big_fil_rev_8_21_14_0_20_43_8]|nr:MAG: hypothetical protein COV93_01045 [Candidatus Woesearchaeota archaeon CG11_big_fil_rev_8_21_14_0_20_43_8]PIO06860.1 MAG: hypothetical protein COT47_02495 [Candidatus Woesearchaeota archaeon CG08_land_8_20_14_0_20_43_7]